MILNMLQIFNDISNYATIIFTVALSIPQLIKLLKDKKTGEINFYSFWIFHIGICLWVFFGALSNTENPYILKNVVIADGVSCLLNGLMTYMLYRFKKEFSKKVKLYAALGVLASWIITGTMVILYITLPNFRLTPLQNSIFGAIAPAFTTFSFLPQLITSIKTKQWRGITSWMFVLYEVNNIFWIIFWTTSMGLNGILWDLVIGLAWQIVSLCIYAYQLTMTVIDEQKFKKSQRKQA